MTDQEISQALHSLLHYYSSSSSSSSSQSSSNPNSPPSPFTSITSVVHYLETKFGVDLSHKADFIRSQLQQFLFQPQAPPQPDNHHQQQHQQQQQHQHQNQHQLQQQQLSHHHLQHHQLHPYQHHHLQHHHQLQQQQQQHPHPQIQTQQPSSFHPKDHYALQQSPNFHPAHSPSFFSSPFPAGLSFQSVPTHHVKPDPTLLPNSTLPPADPAKPRRGGAGGLNKLCGVSPELEAVVGHPALPRTEIVKQLWAYIRKNNLQDPSNKRKIICNDALRLVFETDCTDMFKMNKLLSKHILPLDPTKEASAKKQKVADEDKEKESSDITQTVSGVTETVSGATQNVGFTETVSGGTQNVTGFTENVSGATQNVSGVAQTVPDQSPPSPSVSVSLAPTPAAAPAPDPDPAPVQAPVVAPAQAPSPAPVGAPAPARAQVLVATPAPSVGISDELANFFGVGAREMLQSEVFNRVWDYISSNNLEDPVNPTVVVCDSKLEELFGCQSFPASKIMEVLSRQHIFRA
ncbi:Upstream activation factor subunit spp27 [Linum perenne]